MSNTIKSLRSSFISKMRISSSIRDLDMVKKRKTLVMKILTQQKMAKSMKRKKSRKRNQRRRKSRNLLRMKTAGMMRTREKKL